MEIIVVLSAASAVLAVLTSFFRIRRVKKQIAEMAAIRYLPMEMQLRIWWAAPWENGS